MATARARPGYHHLLPRGAHSWSSRMRTDTQTICDPVPCHEEEEDEEVEDQDDDDEDSDEEEDEDDEVVDEEVNVDFEAYSISDNDYDGIKKLLQQLFLKAPVNTAELTNLLIQQNHIGSVIKQTDASEDSDDDVDEDEIFGFISLLNLTERKGTQCAEQIKELTLSGCAKSCEKSVVEQLDKLFNDPARPNNRSAEGRAEAHCWASVRPASAREAESQQEPCPASLLPRAWVWLGWCHRPAADLCVSCRKELAEAHKTNKPCGKCHFYLLISKTFAEAGKGNSQKKQSSQKKDELMFANAEEEFFYEKAVLTFSYSVQEESDSCLGGRWSFDDVPMKPLRTVMLVPCDRMGEIMAALEEHLSV
ncbi:PREDICTED: BRCA2 and CDKN1A-interacting protein [Myotis davidii]|uniref:BRCA2 and CDKN1A-interacting protein n=1 Tax=Myotis davidii TaxID=225400 RepID=UPI0003EBF526|nr:PREDICTED: BRCA2 and CDKN1A-interacting protein [Myotis davidii]